MAVESTSSFSAMAACADCGSEHEFLRLPLFIITGASGTGKTTVGLALSAVNRQSELDNFIVLDQDILWCSAFDVPGDDYRLFRNTWLRLIKNINQSGRCTVLCGSSIPQQFSGCPERVFFSTVHYCALVCDDDVLEQRLLARPAWRNSAETDELQRSLDFNRWLKSQGKKTVLPGETWCLLDTTRAEVQDTVDALRQWISRLLPGRRG